MATCKSCNTSFNCDVNGSCWCMQFPKILTADNNESCLCEPCLIKKLYLSSNEIVTQIQDGDEALFEKIKAMPKADKLIEGLDYYTENGFFVFTAWHHLRKGYCCNNGCRHCPY
jgi:Family of unknown function (DUF5522)